MVNDDSKYIALSLTGAVVFFLIGFNNVNGLAESETPVSYNKMGIVIACAVGAAAFCGFAIILRVK